MGRPRKYSDEAIEAAIEQTAAAIREGRKKHQIIGMLRGGFSMSSRSAQSVIGKARDRLGLPRRPRLARQIDRMRRLGYTDKDICETAGVESIEQIDSTKQIVIHTTGESESGGQDE
jgi:hypothetical protein